MSRRGSTRAAQRGQVLIEFTFVGILVMFVLISTFEMARTMWIYSTLAHAVKEGSRYAAMRGNNFNLLCTPTPDGVSTPSICTLDVKKVAQVIRKAGTGLVPSEVIDVHMIANGLQDLSCPGPNNSLQGCLDASSPASFDLVNNLNPGATFRITVRYKLSTVFATISRVYTVPSLPASAQEIVQF